MRKTPEEIAAEVAKLREMKPDVRSHNAFGDSHHDAIDAQINVLENGLSSSGVWDRYGDEDASDYADNVLHAAEFAADWRNGDELDSPSNDWISLIQR